jgi:single-strand DNA-binding protein
MNDAQASYIRDLAEQRQLTPDDLAWLIKRLAYRDLRAIEASWTITWLLSLPAKPPGELVDAPGGAERGTGMNHIVVVGNLTREPELRYTPTGAAVVKFGIAVNRTYTNRQGEKVEQTDFFTVNAWRTLAENVAESLRTGTRVIVSGRLQSRSWETEDGDRRTVIEIEADEVGPSLRWATCQVTKAARSGPGEWQAQTAEPADTGVGAGYGA